MSLDPRQFRSVMSRFATGVTVVTAQDGEGRACGLTVNAFTSVSLDPSLVLVSLSTGSATRDAILETGTFAVNVLAVEDHELATRFSRGRRAVRFRGLGTRTEVTGSPILVGALAWLDCRLHQVHEAGDHTLVLGEPVAAGDRPGEPLIFFEGTLRGLRP
jgi:flavin reductase (DIM6/NTAB) family NADH-FMN oxidoreductase RutF